MWTIAAASAGRTHPSRDAIFLGQELLGETPDMITSRDVLEPLKQALCASHDVILSSQIRGSKLQKVLHIRSP